MIPAAITTQVALFGAATLVSLVAFVGLILVPALGSFGRLWEKAAAAFLSIFVLVALAMIGIAVGVVIFLDFANEISDLFSQG